MGHPSLTQEPGLLRAAISVIIIVTFFSKPFYYFEDPEGCYGSYYY